MNFKTYTIPRPSFINNIVLHKRKQIYALLSSGVDLSALNSVLDVGVTADKLSPQSNFFESFFPNPEKIIALSDQDAFWLEDAYPGLRFVQGDGCNLPFPSSSIDLVFSSAVIEHVGSSDRQKKFLEECFRVSSRYIFITTPNRWYPIEFHTLLPFFHWLPKHFHRSLLQFLGIGHLSKEENHNLLTESELKNMTNQISHLTRIDGIRFLGLKSNLILFIDKSKFRT